jgi:alpha-methylacyl-CoA racemase
MLLADLGADVVRVDRPGPPVELFAHAAGTDFVMRGKRMIELDLRDEAGLAQALDLADRADVLVEGFRPGVAERLGMGPSACMERNSRLVYARMTGWGQDGPWSHRAGHDINYISITGALHAIRTAESRPTPPLNLVGDYGGGALYLVTGVLAALVERSDSGRGQVVDTAIVDGVTSLLQGMWSLRAEGNWTDEPAANLLDTGVPYYDTYECQDGRYVAVGALEPRFFAELISGLGLSAELVEAQTRPEWRDRLREQIGAVFLTRTRDEWAAHFGDGDACVTPVLTFEEATRHEHLAARDTHLRIDGVDQAGVVPRFSRSNPDQPRPPRVWDGGVAGLIAEWSGGGG